LSRPLEGTTVWCTRPGRAGERSCSRFHELGATIRHAPTLRIESVVPSAPELAGLHEVAAHCVVALTSPTSATNFVRAAGPVRPDGTPWPVVAVGQKTAIQARDLGLDLRATAPRATARDLVPCVLQSSDAATVVVPGSNLRRPELAAGLREQGRQVVELLVQETVPLRGVPARVSGGLEDIDLLVAYSPSALGFVETLDEATRRMVLSIPLAVMGPTTAAAGRALGFTVVVEPSEPHEDQLLGHVCRWVAANS
jgi:uroporphyrinogen-III synthase